MKAFVTWLSALLLGAMWAGRLPAADALVDRFVQPPDAVKPWAYWWWLDGYASREGITRDLEQMKHKGIAGVLLFDAGEGKGSPVGAAFMSPPWRALFQHAAAEADRLGIVLGVNLCSGWDAGGVWVAPEHACKRLVFSETRITQPGASPIVLPKPADLFADYYRDIAVVAYPERVQNAAKPRPGLKHFEIKSGRNMQPVNQPPVRLEEEHPAMPDDADCQPAEVVDLTSSMDASGRLTWNARPGRWIVLRLGYTLLGSKTKCTSPNTQGYEIDFFSAEAMDMHFANTAAKLIADAGPLAGKTFKYLHDDSYEVGADVPGMRQPDWTPRMRREFRSRRGYDLAPLLPVLAGKIVGGREYSNRFLWDYRRTIADLFASNHYGRFRDLAHRSGLGTHPESGGPFWPHLDALQCLGTNDIPTGEFWKRMKEPDGAIWWVHDYAICDTVKQAASAAHIYGKPVCQAEAFTSMGPNWEEDPAMLKDIGDRAFCAGLTRNMLCFYVHQPRLDVKPGYQWEAAGTHFDRNITWWDQSGAWMTYLARCQHLLRAGRFAADVCYFYGEDVPGFVPAKTHMNPPLPKGRDCDTINADVLLTRISAGDGRLVLPDGMSYRMLVLPQRTTMSPRVLRKIRDLVAAGATIVGPKPRRAPGLSAYPQCDDEVHSLAAELWGDGDGDSQGQGQGQGQGVSQRRVGRGRVVTGNDLDAILRADGIPPDFEYAAQPGATLDYIHRTAADFDLYFVSNQQNRTERADCTFRVAGRQPEIWDPVTGRRWDAPEFRTEAGRTVVPLQFAPRQSWFVVFRKPAGATGRPGKNFPALQAAATLGGPWQVAFDPLWGGPASVPFDALVDWTKRPEPGIKFYSGKATYTKQFDLPPSVPLDGTPVYLDLGAVKNLAEVRLNGKDLGVVWTAPWRVDISGAAKPQGNTLAIDVVNLWPNRLIGDAALPPAQRRTVTNVKKFTKDSPLLESGLLGPVTIQATAPDAPAQRR